MYTGFKVVGVACEQRAIASCVKRTCSPETGKAQHLQSTLLYVARSQGFRCARPRAAPKAACLTHSLTAGTLHRRAPRHLPTCNCNLPFRGPHQEEAFYRYRCHAALWWDAGACCALALLVPSLLQGTDRTAAALSYGCLLAPCLVLLALSAHRSCR